MNEYKLANIERTLERIVHADSISSTDGGVLFFWCTLGKECQGEITHIVAPGQWSEGYLLPRTDGTAAEPEAEQPATETVSGERLAKVKHEREYATISSQLASERLAKAEAAERGCGPARCDEHGHVLTQVETCGCHTCQAFYAGWEARAKVRS